MTPGIFWRRFCRRTYLGSNIHVFLRSEKQRIPAWTDRILYKGPRLQQLQYTRAELYTSDHRPVLALFEAEVHIFPSLFMPWHTHSKNLTTLLLDYNTGPRGSVKDEERVVSREASIWSSDSS